MDMLTQEQRRRFRADGYVVIPGVVAQDLLDAAREQIAELTERNPPPDGYSGQYSLWLDDPLPGALGDLLEKSRAFELASSLTAPRRIEWPAHAQVALTFPPYLHKPGGPHVDGISPTEDDGRPGTFTFLAGFLLTDQSHDDMGNLWVWPGTHLAAAGYLRAHGPDALAESAPYPPVDLPEPRQVHGQAGDLLLAHYLLGHNVGGNLAPHVRETVYFRLQTEGHRVRWRDVVQDALAEFPAG